MEKDAVGVSLERTSRTTRGKRMTRLVDDEIEADEDFWGQDAFKEVAEDAEYEAEEDVVDEFDSDFDEDEANMEEEEVEEESEKVKRKRLLPPGTKPVKKDTKKLMQKTKGLDVIEGAVAAALQLVDDEPALMKSTPRQKHDVHDLLEDPESEKVVRKSTRTAVVIRQAEREALRAAVQVTSVKPVKKKREGERRITQEDMLLEAAQTEILNRQNLERMLAREEEVKQKAIVHKTVYSGPKIRFFSRDGKNFLEFTEDLMLEELFCQADKHRVKKPAATCVVTGLPAKYVDPLTGFPYATKEAFSIIRKRIEKEQHLNSKANPCKKPRSERSISGHSQAKRARFTHHKSDPWRASRMESVHVDFKVSREDEIHDSSALEVPSEETVAPTVHAPPPAQSASPGPETTETYSDHDQSENVPIAASLPHKLNQQLWMEIPPPKEEPISDVYLLDDLTSLEFGPILTLQHGVNIDLQRENDHEISDPTVGPLLPFEYDANVVF